MFTQSRIYQSKSGAASSDLYVKLAEGFVAHSHRHYSSVPCLAFRQGLHLSLLMMKIGAVSATFTSSINMAQHLKCIRLCLLWFF